MYVVYNSSGPHCTKTIVWLGTKLYPEVRPKFITLCNSIKVALRRLKPSSVSTVELAALLRVTLLATYSHTLSSTLSKVESLSG